MREFIPCPNVFTYVSYSIPKPSLQKDSSSTIQPITEEIREFIPFPKGISLKVNKIEELTMMSQFSTLATMPYVSLLPNIFV